VRNTILILLCTAALCLATAEISIGSLDNRSRPQPVQGNALIFADDFESGNLSAWDVSQATNYSLSDSPGADYLPNTDSWAAFNNGGAVDLTAASSSELNFYWYGKYFDDWDYMEVQVSLDNSTWDVVWDTKTGCEELTWTQVIVDLSSYCGNSIYLRFFVHTSSVVEYDGGHYDNLWINDQNNAVLYANSCEDMSDILTGGSNDTWGSEDEGLTDQWLCANAYPYAGLYHATGGPGYYYNNMDSYMAVTGVDLSGSTDAELTCYVVWDPNDAGDVLTVEADSGGGWQVAGTIGATTGYELQTINLDAYAGGTVDLRFHLVTDGSGTGIVPLVDNVEVNATTSSLTESTWGSIKTLF
jgi:hypothetical protein